MTRLPWFLSVLLIGLPGAAVGYDGPGTPLVYNQFINNISILMTVQPFVLNGGYARVTMVAQVPVEADTVGKNITLQLRRYDLESPTGDVVLDSCTRTPAPGSVGSTVSFSCDTEQFVFVGTGLTPGSFFGIYPYVQRPADLPISVLTHDGVTQRLNVPVVGEDDDEPNDTLETATDLGTPAAPLVRTNRVSFLPDYYKVTVPPSAGSMEVRIDFWNAAADIDLFLLDGGGNDITASPFSEDFEQINWDVNPGEVYYIKTEQNSTQPAFYTLTITFTLRDTVTITSGPTATPSVVSAGGTIGLSASAIDSLGHTLNYEWSQVCPLSIGNGTFADRYAASTTWTAPANTSGSPKLCTLRITVNDGLGHSATATVAVTVGLSGDTVTFSVPPAGTPNPVTAPSLVSLNTSATDSFGHALSYAWTASCPTLPNGGSFTPNANQRTPGWIPPTNLTGSTQSCTISVTAADGFGVAATAGYVQQVEPTPHLLTIVSGPAGLPNPVASSGIAALAVNAADTLGHGLTYVWSAACGSGLGTGSFTNAATPTPTWTAPLNPTGLAVLCTIQVIVDDGAGLSQAASFIQTVTPAIDVVTLTAGPTGAPNPVASGGTVAATVTATDTFGRVLSYAWTAACTGGIGNGAFANGTTASPTWTAPANLTGVTRACTIGVTVSEPFGASATGSFQQVVNPAPNPVTIVTPPSGTPNPVVSGGPVAVSVTATDVLGRTLIYAWSSTCGGGLASGSFTNGTTPGPTWNAPANNTGTAQACTMALTVNDGFGNSQSGSYQQTVEPAPNPITFTAGPAGTPNPVGSAAEASVSVTATDVLGRVLTYAWTSTCGGGLGQGTFGNAGLAATTWTAPLNPSGVAQACTIGVSVSDGFGSTQSGSYLQTVNPAPNPITLTAGPTGTPNPIPSGGAVNLLVSATDVFGRVLGYTWSATCAGGLGSGSFAGGATATPTWTAPANLVGTAQTCTIAVSVSDPFGNATAGSYQQTVNPAPNPITITAGPTGSPNPVGSAGAAALTVTATDVLGRTLTYGWSATCAGGLGPGSFTTGATATPGWTAPSNPTGIARACTLAVTVSDGFGNTQTGSYQHTVSAAPNPITLSAGPTGTPNPVASASVVAIAVSATDVLGRSLAYAWSTTCGGGLSSGTFGNAASSTPSWTAPANATGLAQSCTIAVTVSDGFGNTTSGSYQQVVSAAPNPITITAGPAGSPNPVASGGAVATVVSASDTLGRTLVYQWTAACSGGMGNGGFVNGTSSAATWTAPVNATGVARACTLSVSVSDGFGNAQSGSYQQTVDAAPNPITITSGPTGTPNPIASGGTVSLTVTADDVFDRPLVYAWFATCTGGLGAGTFVNPTSATPSWFAPGNVTGASRTCSIGVVVSDAFGSSTPASYEQVVNAAPNAITVSAGPLGQPNPAASGGVVAMSVTATDVLGRPLNYAWSSTCGGSLASGSFAGAGTAAPTWTAPANPTGITQTCTVGVTIDDGLGISITRTYQQQVSPAPNPITITAGPTGTPNPVDSGGAVAVSVTASDVLGRSFAYAWAASCPGGLGSGTFSAASAAPTWTAPVNATGVIQACTIEVSVTDGFGAQATGSYSQQVNSIPCDFTLVPTATSQAADGGGGTVGIIVTQETCVWQASTTAPWLHITSAPSGTGNGVVSFTVDPNPGTARETTIAIAGQTVPISQAGATFTSYFAEGATVGGFFETRFALLNTDPTSDATVTIDFQLKDTATVLTHTLVVPAHARRTIDVSTLGTTNATLAALSSAEFSTVIRSDQPLVADRTMTWDGNGYGSHAESAVLAPATTWYLAEGATIGNFELYYLIQNPNSEALTFTVTYLLPPPAAPIVRSYPIGANTRTNIPVHLEPGLADVEVSAVIQAPAGKPIIVERAMYLSTGGLFYGAGHESAGITAPATQWFFAEGATGDFFDLFILIGNPGTSTAHVTATFLFDDGTTCATTAVVDPKSRFNFWVDTVEIPGCARNLADAAVSTTITADVPVIAERAMWWPGPTAGNWAEAHNAAGATTTGVTWGLAGGEQGGPRATETYILVANTSAYAGTARVTLYLEDGSTLVRTITLPANSRTNVAVGAEFGAAVAGQRFGAVIASQPVVGQAGPAQLVVERAMYSNGPGAPFWAAGTDVLGTKIQ